MYYKEHRIEESKGNYKVFEKNMPRWRVNHHVIRAYKTLEEAHRFIDDYTDPSNLASYTMPEMNGIKYYDGPKHPSTAEWS